jgi:type II secretory pathway pseudopilin PulG
MTTRDRQQDRGETLVELVTAVAILGTAVVALVGGIGTSIVLSDVHRKQATAGAVVRTYAEAIEGAVDASPTGYAGCAKPSAYAAPPGFSTPDGYAATVTAVTYWDQKSSSFVTGCTTDSGLQRVSVSVSSTDTKVTQSLAVIVRNPCRRTDATC